MSLADLESIQKRLDKKNKKNNDENQNQILERAQNLINDNDDINKLYDEFDKKDVKLSGLLSIKPKLYVCNVDENSIDKGNDYTKSFIEKYGSKNTLTISAEIENQLNELENEERKNYMNCLLYTSDAADE